ncbi:MAG TPA: hypothetical protein VNR51_00370 [Hyphomicrobium sp.]|nr:hypothetical protein [Hyphomicrobium sp.]
MRAFENGPPDKEGAAPLAGKRRPTNSATLENVRRGPSQDSRQPLPGQSATCPDFVSVAPQSLAATYAGLARASLAEALALGRVGHSAAALSRFHARRARRFAALAYAEVAHG